MISRLRQKYIFRQAADGFTLIEVLVALSIVVVSFVALYGVIMQMVAATTLMQEKTIASWVAFDRVTELRIAGEYLGAGEKEDTVEMGGISWLYTREVRTTESEDIRQIIVTVSPEDEPENILGLASGVLVRNGRSLGQIQPGDGDPNQNQDLESSASPVANPDFVGDITE